MQIFSIKILANQFNTYKKIIHHDEIDLIPQFIKYADQKV